MELIGVPNGAVDVQSVSDVHRLWAEFIQELQAGADSNNNELKELIHKVQMAVDVLRSQVALLPPQGRQLHFSGSSTIKVMEQIERRAHDRKNGLIK